MLHPIILALLLVPVTAGADEPRFRTVFVSPNGRHELRYNSGQFSQQSWSLIDKATGDVRYRVVGEFASRTVLFSEDGTNLLVVDDFSGREPNRDLDVLLFYRGGSLIKKYSLAELLEDVSNTRNSASHFRWFFKHWALSVMDSRVRLKTFELTSYEFDIHTGDILKKETDPVLAGDAVYVYGRVRKLGGGRFEIEVCHRVRGAVPAGGRIEFSADGDGAFRSDDSYHSVVLRDGKLIATQGVFLNSCNYQRRSRH